MKNKLHATTMVEKLVDGTRVLWPLYKLWDGTRNTCTCMVWYGMLLWYGMLVWYDVSMLWYFSIVGYGMVY